MNKPALHKFIAPVSVLSALLCLPLSVSAVPVETNNNLEYSASQNDIFGADTSAKQDVPPEPEATVVVDNASPSLCNFTREGDIRDVCSRFRLIQLDFPNVTAYQFEFQFNEVQVTYGVLAVVEEIVEQNNQTFEVYPVVGRLLEAQGQDPQFSDQGGGNCLVTPDFTELACGLPNFVYQYTE